MKVLHKIFLVLCRVFHTLWKKRNKIDIDIDHDGFTDISLNIGTHSSEREVNKDDEN